MSAIILTVALAASQVLLGLAMMCSAIRLFVGPRAQDRVLGLDTLYLSGMLLLITHGIQTRTPVYFDVALLIAILGFSGTVAAARFLLRGEVIE